MPQPPKLGLPLRYRRQALARLDTLIAAAERDRGERQAAAERGTRGAKARVRAAEYRLTLLQGSRRWLAAGAPPAD
jgi:hypothetical protein